MEQKLEYTYYIQSQLTNEAFDERVHHSFLLTLAAHFDSFDGDMINYKQLADWEIMQFDISEWDYYNDEMSNTTLYVLLNRKLHKSITLASDPSDINGFNELTDKIDFKSITSKLSDDSQMPNLSAQDINVRHGYYEENEYTNSKEYHETLSTYVYDFDVSVDYTDLDAAIKNFNSKQ